MTAGSGSERRGIVNSGCTVGRLNAEGSADGLEPKASKLGAERISVPAPNSSFAEGIAGKFGLLLFW